MAKNYMKSDEMQILKCVSMKLDDDTVAIVTYQYHTEKNPETGKNDRSKSRYRWLTRVCKIADAKAAIQHMLQDDVRLTPWKWPDDPSWDGKIFTDDSTMKRGADWLAMKLKKMLPFDDAQKQLNGWQKNKNDYNKGAAYVLDGYTATNGDTGISLKDKDTLLKYVGQNLWIDTFLKTELKKQEAAKAVVNEETAA